MGCWKSDLGSTQICYKGAESLYLGLGKHVMKKDDQISLTRFLGKYGGLSIYDIDIEKRYTIDD